MKRFVTTFGLILAFDAGCGYLSNQTFFTGTGRVSGRVWVDGVPVGGAQVFVLDQPEKKTLTLVDGSFLLGEVGAGRELFLVVIWGASHGMRYRFDLAGDGHRVFKELKLTPMGALVGKVSLPEPQSAEVAVVGTPLVTHPDQNGGYYFLLPAGSWDLVVRAVGYQEETLVGARVESGQAREVDMLSPAVDPEYVCGPGELRTEQFTQGGGGAVDILFVVDNSGSMVGEQLALGNSFGKFAGSLEDLGVDYHIAVLTTGMESSGCPKCGDLIQLSCMNQTGENGRFQDRLGHNLGSSDAPEFEFVTDPACRVVDGGKLDCFYQTGSGWGTVLVGVNGCGYERGLSAMRRALQGDLLGSYNAGFLRQEARLALILVSDEEDCGEVDDVYEGSSTLGDVCYYAAKGVGPQGETSHPEDPLQRPYRLTPVEEYAAFLGGLKPVSALVTFSAIVGLLDPGDPSTTAIEYRWNATYARWEVVPACTAPGCTGSYCDAMPGTRYLELATRLNGTVETICQQDFSDPMLHIAGTSAGHRLVFQLSRVPESPLEIKVFVDGQEVSAGWAYSSKHRGIVFERDQAPAPYSLVAVEYPVACP